MKDKIALYYDPLYCFDNVIVSVDMVRCRFFIRDIEMLFDFFRVIDSKYQTDIYSSLYPLPYQKIGKYKYFAEIPVPSGNTSFICAFGFYSKDGLQNIVDVDFNPNKCLNKGISSEIPIYLLHWLHQHSIEKPEIKRFDLAFDFYGVNRPDVFSYVADSRMPSSVGRGDNVTRSFGAHNKHGHLKIYNKTAESKLDCLCTRIEVTVSGDKVNDFKEISRCFGSHCALIGSADTRTLNDRFAFALFYENAELFNDVLASADPRTKKKYKTMIKENSRELQMPSESVDGVPLCSWVSESLKRCILSSNNENGGDID